ncbi:flagellar hook-length control protein FliK, partial [Conyzicola sp.]|uniref:flagellar hook-length control protein FliK n=1 Tax=Conyzicola sp. TaxID=1969404 RepID=UPI00398A456E
ADAAPVATSAAASTADTAVDAVVQPKDAPAPVVVAVTPAASAPVAVTGAAASAPPVAQPAPLAAQVAVPVFTLAAAGNGEHVMTIDIVPENLGPITVRAHVGTEGVRVELFAPNDLAREALRAILPDIRKDMGGAGLGGTLDLSSQNQPTDRGDGGQQRRQQQGDTPGALEQQQQAAARPWLLTDPSTTIDVMA